MASPKTTESILPNRFDGSVDESQNTDLPLHGMKY